MISHELSVSADAAAHRYARVTDSFQRMFVRTINSGEVLRPDMLARVTQEATDIASFYLDAEYIEIREAISQIASRAHQTTLNDSARVDNQSSADALDAHLNASQQYLSLEILSQAQRDIALLRSSLQRVALELTAIVRSRGMSQDRALVEYLLNSDLQVDFVFRDRRARRWSSTSFVRSVWRQTLLSAFNETVMLIAADYGVRALDVVREEEGVATVVDRISIDGSSDLPAYSEIRDDYFHPNSNARLVMEISHV